MMETLSEKSLEKAISPRELREKRPGLSDGKKGDGDVENGLRGQ